MLNFCFTPAPLPQVLLESEDVFQGHLAEVEAAAGVDLLLLYARPGSAVDTGAPGHDPDDYTTWQPCPARRRGNESLLVRRFVCHCNGTSSVKLAADSTMNQQQQLLANWAQAESKGRWAMPLSCTALTLALPPAAAAWGEGACGGGSSMGTCWGGATQKAATLTIFTFVSAPPAGISWCIWRAAIRTDASSASPPPPLLMAT